MKKHLKLGDSAPGRSSLPAQPVQWNALEVIIPSGRLPIIGVLPIKTGKTPIDKGRAKKAKWLTS